MACPVQDRRTFSWMILLQMIAWLTSCLSVLNSAAIHTKACFVFHVNSSRRSAVRFTASHACTAQTLVREACKTADGRVDSRRAERKQIDTVRSSQLTLSFLDSRCSPSTPITVASTMGLALCKKSTCVHHNVSRASCGVSSCGTVEKNDNTCE